MSLGNAFTASDLTIERAGGRLARRKGLYLVHLQGSYAAMGRQHGELAEAVCGDVVARYVNELVYKLVAHALPSVAAPVAGLLKGWFRWRNRSEIGVDLGSHLHALARAYGQTPAMAERLLLVPDIFHYLAGRSFSMLAPPPACSGFFACGAATHGGKLLIGRNFDFFGRGVWNVNHAAIVMRPERGQRFCWIGALGVSGSGQGFNESGLVVGLHTNFPRDVQSKGSPIFRIVHDLLAECSTLDQAIARITSKPRMCGLSLFVTDTRARTAAVVGFSAHHEELLRPENGMLVRTNHYVTPAMQRIEVGPHVWRNNSWGRFQRITSLLAEKHGVLTAQDIPGILSDCVDPFSGEKVLVGNTVAAPHNVQSFIMSPDDDALWLAHGDFPVCHNARYLGFRMSSLLSGDVEHCEIEDLAGGAQLHAREHAALFEYEEALSSYVDHLDTNRAIFHLRRAMETMPEEAVFPRMAGLLLLKGKQYAQALPLLMRDAAHDHGAPLAQAEAHVWVGRCLDLMGRRAEAVVQYQEASRMEVPPISGTAARLMEKPFKPRHLFHVSPEFMVGGALAKY